MRNIFGFIAPILVAVCIIVACKKEETKTCDTPSNTFSYEFYEGNLKFTFLDNVHGLTQVELGPYGFLPGAGIRKSGASTVVFTDVAADSEFQYYVRTDCCDENYSEWAGPLYVSTICDGEVDGYRAAVNGDQATIYWFGNPEKYQLVEVEYGEKGFAQGNGLFANSSGESITLQGLTDGLYEFYGRTLCSGGNYSAWVGPFSFEIRDGGSITCDGTYKEAPSIDVVLTTQSEVDTFGGQCYTYVSHLIINSFGSSEPINDLSKLSSLTEIGNELTIESTQLQSLTGLENITSLGNGSSIRILSNNNLSNISSLANISTDVEGFYFRNNPILEDFCPIANFVINYVDSFESLTCAYNPTKQDMIDGNCKP